MRRAFAGTEATLIVVIVLMSAVFALQSPYFLTPSNAVDLLESYSVTTILAAGVFVVLVSGGIDISFAATASVAQYVAASAAARYGMPPIPTILISLAVGTLLGATNALLTYFLKVSSIIVTIATSSIYLSLLITISGGAEIYNIPEWWTNRLVFLRFDFADGEFARITLPIVIMIVVVVFTHLIMAHSKIGREVYALGGNAESAQRLGVRVLRVQIFVYGYLGLLSGLAGFIQAHRVGQAVPTAMVGTELNVLAVAVLGGASLVGGIGTMGGVALGVLLLAILQNGLNLAGVPYQFFQIVIGLVILTSVSATALAERQRSRSRRGEG